MSELAGTSGNDVMVGTSDADLIDGREGNDRINAGSGNDTVYGGLGNDAINGEAGNDVVYGGAGNDTLTGDAGNDLLVGEDGNDGFFGGGGDDTIEGGAGNDTMYGDGANDSLMGGDGADKLYGGAGNDTLDGGAGNDVLSGDAGNDTFIVRSGDGADVVSGGTGFDTVVLGITSADIGNDLRADLVAYDAWMAAQLAAAGGSISTMITLATGATFTFASLGITISSVESLKVQVDGVDTPISALLNAAPVADALVRLSASEDVSVTGQVVASDANGDVLAYTVDVGPQHGTLELDEATGAYVYRGAENFSGSDTFTVRVDDGHGGSTIEVVEVAVSGVADAPTLLVAAASMALAGNQTGTSGNDTLWGGIGDDTIYGGAGNDVIYGDPSSDTVSMPLEIAAALADTDGSETLSVRISGLPAGAMLSAGVRNADGSWTLSGTDLAGLLLSVSSAVDISLLVTATATEQGGSSASTSDTLDIVFVRGTSSDVLDGGAGNDTVYGGAGSDLVKASDGNDVLDGGAGFDILDMSDATSAVTVNLTLGTATGLGTDSVQNFEAVLGSSFDDNLKGNKYDSILWGGDGNDSLYGGGGDDTLDGGHGNDVIVGGGGSETLIDGDGNDSVNGGAGSDTFIAGAGNDTYVGGTGFDVVDYSTSSAAVSVDLGKQTASGWGSDSLSGIEKVVGSAFADTLTGSSSADVLAGGAGNDTIRGMGGADTLTGGAGSDTFQWSIPDLVSGKNYQGRDVITDFSSDDHLDLTEFSKSHKGQSLDSYIFVNDQQAGSLISVKIGSNTVDVALLEGVHGVTVDQLFEAGMLVV